MLDIQLCAWSQLHYNDFIIIVFIFIWSILQLFSIKCLIKTYQSYYEHFKIIFTIKILIEIYSYCVFIVVLVHIHLYLYIYVHTIEPRLDVHMDRVCFEVFLKSIDLIPQQHTKELFKYSYSVTEQSNHVWSSVNSLNARKNRVSLNLEQSYTHF